MPEPRNDSYRTGLARVVGGASLPYGYTLSVSTSVAVLVHRVGAPGLADALALTAAATAGFVAAAVVAGPAPMSMDPDPGMDPRKVGLSSGVAAGGALCLSDIAGHIGHGWASYACVGLVVTISYLLVNAIGLTVIAAASGQHRSGGGDLS